MGSVIKTRLGFISHGTRCSGWLYYPKGIKKPPIVLMAHGLAAEKTFGLPAFAEAYAEAGYAVFLFDYRNHGDSEGVPRNLVRASRHIQDWEVALARVKRIPNINPEEIILWGASFSGGHTLVLAARHPEIAAVISHVAFTDGFTALQGRKVNDILKGAGAGLLDAILSLGGVRCAVPVVAEAGALACLNQPGALAGYTAMLPPESAWKNECPASIFLTLPWYRPIKMVTAIKCPVLMIKAREDNIISGAAIDQTWQQIPRGCLLEIEGGHFDFYAGEIFNHLIQEELKFLADNGLKKKSYI